jgi:hypothetical protein
MIHDDLSPSSHHFCLFFMGGGPHPSDVPVEHRVVNSYSLAPFSWKNLVVSQI